MMDIEKEAARVRQLEISIIGLAELILALSRSYNRDINHLQGKLVRNDKVEEGYLANLRLAADESMELLQERNEARRHACQLLWERDEARGELGAIQQLAEDAVNTESWLLGMRLRQRLLAFAEKRSSDTYDPHEVASLGYEVEERGHA